MSYTNATFYLDYEGGSDSARTALTTVTAANPSGTITRMTKTAHGLVTGAVVDLTLFTAWLNAAWKITVVDADNFDLDSAVWQATADNSGTATPRGGSSKTDAWKTTVSGATSARIAAGDTIRMMASPDATSLGQTATWTQNSKTVTLTTAVTANITDCETAWTASANVTSTADTSQFKENTKSAKHVIAAGFTTGLVSFFATGTLDLSAYQQVSLWYYNTAALAASTLSLRLCSDVAGVTTVNTIAIPANPATSQWCAATVDTGGALGASIKSVALYADLDPGSQTIQIDNILAVKSVASDDSLSLTSLIGKVKNMPWVASTVYSAGDVRTPTSANRNGLRYTASAGTAGGTEPTWPASVGATVVDNGVTWTCEGIEDTWYAIQSINGTTVKLDNATNTLGSAGRGYGGETESITTCKREPIKYAVATNFSDNLVATTISGTVAGGNITYSGGWNRTDMTTQTGQTWYSGSNGYGYGFNIAHAYITMSNFNMVRAYRHPVTNGPVDLINCHINNSTGQGVYATNTSWARVKLSGVAVCNHGAVAVYVPTGAHEFFNVRIENNIGIGIENDAAASNLRVLRGFIRNNGDSAIYKTGAGPWKLSNLTTGNNTGTAITDFLGGITLYNCTIPEATEFTTPPGGANYRIQSSKHDGTADLHYILTDSGSIISATDQRNTASGISWKFRPTNAVRDFGYPLVLSVAKIACTSGVAVNLNIYTRRDNTNIKGQLCVEGGQIAGVDADVTVACEPSINTWTNSSTLTFTPTETGVIEVTFKVWDGVGSSNNYWIDDLTIA